MIMMKSHFQCISRDSNRFCQFHVVKYRMTNYVRNHEKISIWIKSIQFLSRYRLESYAKKKRATEQIQLESSPWNEYFSSRLFVFQWNDCLISCKSIGTPLFTRDNIVINIVGQWWNVSIQILRRKRVFHKFHKRDIHCRILYYDQFIYNEWIVQMLIKQETMIV